ncbi:hypothetical protein OIDMADRAFT_195808 [Oidiodendron maius Zn]|uniref:Uncharacterized protein n=1 Tax=Oidiodendron maius (strain Zn) TaxID=913774 RepID=A0A0C3HLK4_OIDMZ|nr:hypothetical protein OIDMADRAFT_195808 [Oidiodendron maius Zn]
MMAMPAIAINNSTFTIPEGGTNHGNPNLLYTPTKWTDIVVFILGNCVAHAATVKVGSGFSAAFASYLMLGALLVPTVGILRGIEAIISLAKLSKSNLYTAAQASALCIVVRTNEWKPYSGDKTYAILATKQTQAGID